MIVEWHHKNPFLFKEYHNFSQYNLLIPDIDESQRDWIFNLKDKKTHQELHKPLQKFVFESLDSLKQIYL